MLNVRSRVPEHSNTHSHFSAMPSPDPNKRAHHISKSLGGRILPLHALQGVTHKVFPPWEPISSSCLRVWKVRGLPECVYVCVSVCLRYKWGHNVSPCPFLKILLVYVHQQGSHKRPLTSILCFSNYQSSVVMTNQTASGKLMHQHNYATF